MYLYLLRRAMASTVWKGYISFGLVSVPVRLYAAAREQHVSFNQIHEVCGSRIKQQTFCPVCERVVERNELVKGYQVDKDAYVLVSPDELKTLQADSSEAMEITQFVSLNEVDPIYYEASYYSAPEDPGKRAYGLLLQAMEKLNVAAIAKLTLNQREQIVLMRPYHQGIVLHTLYFPSEVREVAEYGKADNMTLQKPEIDLAEQFIRQLTAQFQPEQYKDEYQQRVLDLVETKRAGQIVAGQPLKPKLAPVIDLMEALKKSIADRGASPALVETGKKKASKSAPAADAKPARGRKTG
jgi:DNA end-binding protein Ku